MSYIIRKLKRRQKKTGLIILSYTGPVVFAVIFAHRFNRMNAVDTHATTD